MIPRELSSNERAEIRKLVVSQCANYDKQYGCLPLDCPCYMLNKCWTGAYCKYFKNAVLPLQPSLLASLMDMVDTKCCAVCEKPFAAQGRQKYCSTKCQCAGQREAERKKKRRQRQNKA